MASSDKVIELDADEMESFKSIVKKDPGIQDFKPFAQGLLVKHFGDEAPKNMFVGVASEKDSHVLYFVDAKGGLGKPDTSYSIRIIFSCSF